jgi:glycerol-3-phosphate acyltransferase PlsY
MDPIIYTIIFSVFAYLLGSISSAIITCKLMGLQDPRTTGSRNPGATNVLRLGGKKAAIITLFGDMLKGLVPVLIAAQFGVDNMTLALVGFFAFLGHIFPLYYGFKGGKGVATYFGVILGINWQVGLVALLIWLTVALLLKISSLSALVSMFLTPFVMWNFTHSVELTTAVIVMSMIAFWRHTSNILALVSGREEKIKSKK